LTLAHSSFPTLLARIELWGSWIVWAFPFLFRAPHFQRRQSITVAGPTRWGILLQAAAFAVAFIGARGAPRTNGPALACTAILGVAAAVLAWTSVAHLGKQFRIHAGLYTDHELVRTGPYAVVRHPIYTSVLVILLTTIVLLTPWPPGLVAVALCIAGTEIRVRTEDRLLASRFGKQFEEYRRQVRAYLPFLR
jgi:protein-S-isoprenylcysteine O-methyltransferase Ste14